MSKLKVKVKRKNSNLFWYFFFRVASLLASTAPPVVRSLMLFPMWKKTAVVQVKVGLGFGAVLALVILAFYLKSTVVDAIKKRTGLARVLVVAAIWGILAGLRLAAPYICKLEDVAFWAVLGSLASWGLAAIATIFKLKHTGSIT